MHALIVHCHPEPASFNAALTALAVQTISSDDWMVEVSDLYRENFDPTERPEHYSCRNDSNVFSPLGEQRHASRSGFLPADVSREIARLEKADLVIFQFPLWWHSQPAMLKGWFDRVFVNGGLYTSKKRYDKGHFTGKRAICSITTGAPESTFGQGARGGDLDTMLWPIEYSLHYMGFSVLPRFVSYGIQGHGYTYQGQDQLREHLSDTLAAWENKLRSLPSDTPLNFPGWENWE